MQIGPNLFERQDGEQFASSNADLTSTWVPPNGAHPSCGGVYPPGESVGGSTGLFLVAQTGYGVEVQSGALVRLEGADRFVIRAVFVEPGGKNVPKTFVAQIYGARSPKAGEKGFKESLAWAHKRFPNGMTVNGKTFGGLKWGVLTEILVDLDGRPALDVLDVLLINGMAKLDDARVPPLIRSDPHFPLWKEKFLKEQAQARRNHVGLWHGIWK